MNNLLPVIVLFLFAFITILTCGVRMIVDKIIYAEDVSKAQKWLDEHQGESIDYDD